MSEMDLRCLFCDHDTEVKIGCQRKRWTVCGDHFMVECPVCGYMAFWMEKMKSGAHYACFSPYCAWRATCPPNA